MAERFKAAVLKTVDCNRSGGSNPSLSAEPRNLLVLIIYAAFSCSACCSKTFL